jgi:hypothetical protein
MSSNFVRFGPSNPITVDDIDPVSSCVGNTYFNPNGREGANLQIIY